MTLGNPRFEKPQKQRLHNIKYQHFMTTKQHIKYL